VSAGQVLAAVAAVLFAAFAVRHRRRLGAERTAGALLAAAALGVYASGVLSGLPDAKTVIADIASALGPGTYALVGGLAFLETGAFVGLVAPGETVVIAGGVIAGEGEIELGPLIGLVWVCAVLGDTTSFFVGRKLGRRFLLRHGSGLKITEQRLERVERYFERHGGKTIIIGRFIGLVRALAPFIAGSSGLAYRRFLPYSVVGTGLWASLFTVLGYVFYRSFDRVAGIAGQATLAFAFLVGIVVGAVVAYRRLRDEEQRARLSAWLDRQERQPALRPPIRAVRLLWARLLFPAWRAAAPRVRFAFERLTPGGLGLELTTTLAVAGVGLYVFTVYTVHLSGDRGPTPLDRETLDVAGSLAASAVVDVVKVATELGSFPTVATLVFVTAVVLAVRRRPIELVSLLVGTVLVYAAVQLTKAGVDRPRPPRPLIETSNEGFPSGHAAYSTAWVAVAVVASRAVPGLAGRASLVIGALAVAVGVGLSRIYLRAHYWSDVVGGWALGFGVFGTCAAIALIVAYIGHNGRTREAASEVAAPATKR
jgi:membrane protein DedA with SNARE-associated domain/membrane-associated phospholipid phosphatase